MAKFTEANTIVEQLGGIGKLTAMIGAKDFTWDRENRTLTFKFRLCQKVNCVRIKLVNDLYDVEFIKIYPLPRKISAPIRQPEVIESFEMLDATQLISTFESVTGLRLSLGTMGGQAK